MKIKKRFMTRDKDDFLHSNGYARVASGGKIGSASTESFEKRLQIDNNRRIVGRYRSSTIGNPYGVMRAKSIDSTTVDLNAVKSEPDFNKSNSEKPIINSPKRFDPYR